MLEGELVPRSDGHVVSRGQTRDSVHVCTGEVSEMPVSLPLPAAQITEAGDSR